MYNRNSYTHKKAYKQQETNSSNKCKANILFLFRKLCRFVYLWKIAKRKLNF